MYPPASNGTGGAMFIVPEEENSTPEMRQTPRGGSISATSADSQRHVVEN